MFFAERVKNKSKIQDPAVIQTQHLLNTSQMFCNAAYVACLPLLK